MLAKSCIYIQLRPRHAELECIIVLCGCGLASLDTIVDVAYTLLALSESINCFCCD